MRGLRRKPVVLGTFAALALLVGGGVWPQGRFPEAAAEPTEVEQLQADCEGTHAWHRQAFAIAQLVEIDSGASHQALETLANSEDAGLANQAIWAIGRNDYGGGGDFLKGVLEKSTRTFKDRSAALTAYLRQEAAHGRTWADVSAYVESKTQGDQDLHDVARATGHALWPQEVEGE